MIDFEIAAGSVTGSHHLTSGKCLIGRNNQDAYAIRTTPYKIAAVICDGCGSGSHSEVGAWMAAEFLAEQLINYADSKTKLPRIFQSLSAHICIIAESFGDSLSRVISDYFLFSILGVVVTPRETIIFSLGDGVFAWSPNHILNEIKFPNNAPPYLGYGFVESAIDNDLLEYKFLGSACTDDITGVMIGSDGMSDYANVAHECIPGTTEQVGAWSDIFYNDHYYSNPEALTRRFKRMNSEVTRIDKETGRLKTSHRLLPDDTTAIYIRRKIYETGN